jgi:hypothetical protein
MDSLEYVCIYTLTTHHIILQMLSTISEKYGNEVSVGQSIKMAEKL